MLKDTEDTFLSEDELVRVVTEPEYIYKDWVHGEYVDVKRFARGVHGVAHTTVAKLMSRPNNIKTPRNWLPLDYIIKVVESIDQVCGKIKYEIAKRDKKLAQLEEDSSEHE